MTTPGTGTGHRVGAAARAVLAVIMCLSCLLGTSCSTEKAKWGNIRYHDLTCHYNVWWNGNESLKAGRLKLRQSAVDDYTQLLPVENLGTDENARSVYPEMDRAIEKGVKGIKKHSIFVKGVEHVSYIKECYLLTAYASFYKHDYIAAANSCNILQQQFQGTRAGDEGAVLLARCLVKEQRYDEAEAALDQLVQNLAKGNFSRSQRDKLYIAMVEATVPQKRYKKAVEYIHEAIDASSDSYTKARLAFLMAQIYRELDKRPVAARYYKQVLSYHPPYILEFNARLGRASCADLQNADIAALERDLDDMYSDRKNIEYRDQILFAKGEMFYSVGQYGKAADSYRRSVAAATGNQAQRAQSSLRMGQLQYDVFQDYDLAQRYYDTAMQSIDATYPGYGAISRRHEVLTELATYTRVVDRCDSLRTVAALPEAERLALVNNRIEALRQQEAEERERALLAEFSNEANAQRNTLTGDWYFYNAQTLAKGKETFRQRWGLRALEDLWCLANKTVIAPIADLPPEADADSTAAGTPDAPKTAQADKLGDPTDPHNVAYYLKELPVSPRDFDSLDSLTSLSLLNAGYILYDGVGNVPRAVDCYLRLAADYTSLPEVVQAFYMLYRIYDRQGNTPQANYYREMVLMGFPDSDFANLIRDSEYYKELQRRSRRIESDYETLYAHYSGHRYSAAISLADQVADTYPDHPMLPKFRFWQALALARTGNTDSAVAILRPLAALPATDTMQALAQHQLDLLLDGTYLAADDSDPSDETITPRDEQRAAQRQAATTATPSAADAPLPPEAQVYRYRPEQQHYVVILVNDRTVKATELQHKIVLFNNQYYSNSGFKVTTTLFTDTTQLISVYNFPDAAQAMGYWRHLRQQESPLVGYAADDCTAFPISLQNYATFYNRKRTDFYLLFFNRYYIKQQ